MNDKKPPVGRSVGGTELGTKLGIADVGSIDGRIFDGGALGGEVGWTVVGNDDG